MSIFKINRQVLKAPVINTENGELLGQSSIAIFRKEDLYMAYLVVNTLDGGEDDPIQLLIPFSDIVSVNQYSISVRFSDEDELPIPFLAEEYMELVGRPIRQANIDIGSISEVTVDTATAALQSAVVEKNGQLSTFSGDEFSCVDDICVVNSEEAPAADENQQEEILDDSELKFDRLESLLERISQQLETFNEYMVSLKDNKKSEKTGPVQDIPTMSADDLQDPNSLLLGKVDNIAEMLEALLEKAKNGELSNMSKASGTEDITQPREAELPDEQSKVIQIPNDFISEEPESPENDAFEWNSGLNSNAFEFINETEAENQISDEDNAREKIAPEQAELIELAKRMNFEDNGDFGNLFEESETLIMEAPEIQSEFEVPPMPQIEDMETMDTTSPLAEDSFADNNEENKFPDQFELQKPFSDEGSEYTDLSGKIQIDTNSFFDDMLEAEEKPETISENSEAKAETDIPNTIISEKSAPEIEQKPTGSKRKSTFWKICGLQVLSGILFAGAYIAMNIFGL